jgi:hypothetical protein
MMISGLTKRALDAGDSAAIFKHFSTLLVFSVRTAFRRPPQRQ